MRRILFVDDEPEVLEGLRRALRGRWPDWHKEFCQSGTEALRLMTEAPVDAIVADLRMPHMGGAQLLAEVTRRSPKTVRIILSGVADVEVVRGMRQLKHQYLVKPCDPEVIMSIANAGVALAKVTPRAPAAAPVPDADGKAPLDLNDVVRRAVEQTRNEWAEVATVSIELDPALPQVTCLRSSIVALVMNLLVHSAHAVSETGTPGTIRLETRRVGGFCELRHCDGVTKLSGPVRARLGPGTSSSELTDPKVPWLALAHLTVVKNHRGELRVEPHPAGGDEFVLRLPLG